MFSGSHETALLGPQEKEHCKRFSGSFCALNFADAIEQKLCKNGVELQATNASTNSIFAALAAARTLTQNEYQKNLIENPSLRANCTKMRYQTNQTATYPVDKNYFPYENINFLFLATLPDPSNSPLNPKLTCKSPKNPETQKNSKQEASAVNSNISPPIASNQGESPLSCAFNRNVTSRSSKQIPDVKKNHRKEETTSTGLFKCSYCPKVFPFQCHLQVHERVHTKEKPYRCSLCPRQFSQLGSLTVHQRIHTGEMPYFCFSCSKKFRHVNSLKRHQRQLHHGQTNCFKQKCMKMNDGDADEAVSSKKAKNFHAENCNQTIVKHAEDLHRKTRKTITKSESASAWFQSAKNNDTNCSLNQIKAQETPKYENYATTLSICANENLKQSETSNTPPPGGKPSTSIFKSIEKLLSVSSNSAEIEQNINSKNKTASHIIFPDSEKIIDSGTSALFLPQAQEPQTLTTTTLSYEANSILRQSSLFFSESNNLLWNGAKIRNNFVNQRNLLLLPSLVFSDQFCKSTVKNAV